MAEQTSAVRISKNVKQWRDFFDILLFARQNRADLVVTERYPALNEILELKNNTAHWVQKINELYKQQYSGLRVYRGEFDHVSSLLVLKNAVISSGRNFQKKPGQRLLCLSSNNARNSQLEKECDFLAISIINDDCYMGSKIFMSAHMIELLSL